MITALSKAPSYRGAEPHCGCFDPDDNNFSEEYKDISPYDPVNKTLGAFKAKPLMLIATRVTIKIKCGGVDQGERCRNVQPKVLQCLNTQDLTHTDINYLVKANVDQVAVPAMPLLELAE